MALNVNVDVFSNKDIREAVTVIRDVASRRKLGIPRWDNVLDMYPYSGTVVIPVKIGARVFKEPFYFVIEKVNDRESLRIKPVKGDQWSLGDVYGFFGLYDFFDYTLDMPILVVEGLSDWAAVKPYYKYTLSSLSAWVGYRQCFFISGISSNIFLGYDLDETGDKNKNRNSETLNKMGANVGFLQPPQKDWGHMFESDFGKMLLEKTMLGFMEKVNSINRKILYK
jgi:hypothetical protein